MSRAAEPYVSVVIPTYNRAGLLRRTIPALVQQQTDGFAFEVIFVSNGSTDDTAAVLAEAAARHPETIRFCEIPASGAPAAPRNVGIRRAGGSVIIILDDDVLPEPDLVLSHARFHREHPERFRAAVGSTYVPAELLGDPMSLFHEFAFGVDARELDVVDYVYFWTCNVSLKREFMLEAGMFDERFGFNEDIVCGHRLAAGGMKLHYLPAARGQHHHQEGDPASVPARGRHIGRWHYLTVQELPEPAIKQHYGVLSTDLSLPLLIRRLANRTAFRVLDNPATRSCLRLLGATNGKRSRVSDLYYYLIFRRNVVAGFHQARREGQTL